MGDVEEQEGVKSWNLLPLTPKYLPSEHGRYVAEIEVALKNPEIRNIALSGNYGVGKSSILGEVRERQGERVVVLSLSTLTPIENSDLEGAVPKQATTPTNRIQQEIVKQLLYREKPSKTPGSRFQRIEHFAWGREVSIAALFGAVATVVFLLTGWSAHIRTELTPLVDLGLWIHPTLLILAGSGMLWSRYLLHGRIRIKQLSAGSATVTLDENSVSYFDQYLDEIVYFFEVSKSNVVIFEDIDRFNNSQIFETLRALNTLLNAVPRIEEPIRFIYAIKDSIFDKLGLEQENRKIDPDILAIEDPAQAEAMRANRTKFFDLVISVVPFVTHRSARNLAAQLLGKIEHDVSPALIDLATRHVPDMRLLKNVRNEFVIFRDRIFSGEGKSLTLNETDLFAMMLYKSTHLTDFERIRIGTSTLDELMAPAVAEGCTITGGQWYSFYDDAYIDNARSLDIDHMVPLAESWDSGAHSWDKAKRQAYANDLGAEVPLIAVTAKSNRSKSDKDPAEWMPPAEDAACRYAFEWVSVKTRWNLAVDTAEAEALEAIIAGCPDATVTVTAP